MPKPCNLKACRGRGGKAVRILTSDLDVGGRADSRSVLYFSGKRAIGIHWIGVGLEVMAKKSSYPSRE
jgi:hypothetical protein